ncbi:unnamed protein product [Pneumocystis jirovecii]|uniref:Matrin-type domain-containing protein n=2 Tax=Pneumocystis jirovecii TaxID=42068 RepID=L0PDC6_PNEJI|nr:uncharacterized protein T551_03324 [Pneumocystis jirovecii RU7]KTW26862.1 hypothetical protein T551_03324 [Pneumocystis jirovecii RU7]CCJ30371.1 unnamed protein product [Pneumocystis jirovecii]
MTDVWRSVGNYWCKYCKTFVRNDAFSRKKHEASDRHQGSLKRFLRDLDKKNEKEEREKRATQRELDRIAGVTGLSTRSISVVSPKKVAKTPLQKTKPVARKTEAPFVDIKATVGIPGPWEVVSPSETEKKMNSTLEVSENRVEDSLTSINIVEKPMLTQPRLKEDYEDLRSFKIEEKIFPSETECELEETSTTDFFKKRKFKIGKNIRKK